MGVGDGTGARRRTTATRGSSTRCRSLTVASEEGGSLFVVEEPAFSFDAAAVASEGAVGSDDAVAGDDDGDGVRSVGEADGADGGGAADGGGELAVGGCGAAGNIAQGLPDLALEGSAGCGNGEMVDGVEFAGEVTRYRRGEAVGIASGGEIEAARAVVFAQLAEDDVFGVAEEGGTQVTGLVGNEHQGTDGRGELIERERQQVGVEEVGHARNRRDSSAFSHGRAREILLRRGIAGRFWC